jgi:hypothetical protein
MAQQTVEELANDYTSIGINPGGIGDSVLTSAGGGGGGGSAYVPPYSIDPYTSPYIQPRVIVFTINTYASLSRNGVLAKAFLDGVEVEDQTISKGKITFTMNEQRLLNPSRLTIVSGDLKAEKYFLIQSRKDSLNEVSVIEFNNMEEYKETLPPDTNLIIDTPPFMGGGGSGGGGGGFGGGMREVNPNDYRGAGFGLDGGDVTQRENLQ